MRKNHQKQVRLLNQQIRARLRFDDSESPNESPEATQFRAAMKSFLDSRRRVSCTCGEILDTLVSIGYLNAKKDFLVNVQELAAAIGELKRRLKRRQPTWTEVLEILQSLGWQKA